MRRTQKRPKKKSPAAAGSPLFRFDDGLKDGLRIESSGVQEFLLVGIDEAGRGPLAGPVVAGAVCLPHPFFDASLADSKLLSPPIRERLYRKIVAEAYFGVAVIEVEHIDTLNILRATHRAMKHALLNLIEKHPALIPGLVAVDGNPVPDMGYRQKSIVQGDRKSAAIAAASVIAKVTRDRIMHDFHVQYPQYGFARHKGYGTKLHIKNLEVHGPCPIHRKSFAPVRQMVEGTGEELKSNPNDTVLS